MREIKFRGLSENIDGTKDWVYGYLSKCDGKFTIDDEDGFGCFVDEETIGEYTGVKDANGVEIYESDIVKMIDYRHKGVVKYINGALFIIDWNDKHLNGSLYFWNNNQSSIEVIGNIFENKELLDQENE